LLLANNYINTPDIISHTGFHALLPIGAEHCYHTIC